MSSKEIVMMPRRLLRHSPFQYRRKYSQAALESMADTMRQPGGKIYQPLLVRPIAGQADVEATHEIVFGHRRDMAAAIAGLDEVPVMVEEMSDQEAMIAQLIENIQREDTDPIDEAEGLLALKGEGLSIPELEQHTGKKKSYLYARFKLATVTEPARSACANGHMDPELACLVATFPTALQPAAYKRVHAGTNAEGRPTFIPTRKAKDVLKTLTTDITTATWELDDATILAKDPCVVNCSTCPRLSRNDEAMCETVGPDKCLDSTCFRHKQITQVYREADNWKAQGHDVIEFGEAEAFLAQSKNTHLGAMTFILGGKVTVLEAALEWAKQDELAAKPLIVVDPSTFSNVHLFPKDRMDDLIDFAKRHYNVAATEEEQQADTESPPLTAAQAPKERGKVAQAKKPSPSPRPAAHAPAYNTPRFADDDEQFPWTDEYEAISEMRHWKDLNATIMEVAAGRPRTTDELRMVIRYLLEQEDEVPDEVLYSMRWELEWQDVDLDYTVDWLDAKMATMSADELGKLLVLWVISQTGNWAPLSKIPTQEKRVRLARTYGVDVLTLQVRENTNGFADVQAAFGGELEEGV